MSTVNIAPKFSRLVADRTSVAETHRPPPRHEISQGQSPILQTNSIPVAQMIDIRSQKLGASKSQGQGLRPPPFMTPSSVKRSNMTSARSEHPRASLPQLRYECPFYSLSCYRTFNDFEEWRDHSLSHFGAAGPPSMVKCNFCAKEFFRSFSLNALESWKAYMKHLEFHQRRGSQMGTAQPDADLYKYMFGKQLITLSDYNRLQILPAHTTENHSEISEAITNRIEDPWTSLDYRPASPDHGTPASGALLVDPQRTAALNSARKHRLDQDGEGITKMLRKQRACEDCRKKKKRVFDPLTEPMQTKKALTKPQCAHDLEPVIKNEEPPPDSLFQDSSVLAPAE